MGTKMFSRILKSWSEAGGASDYTARDTRIESIPVQGPMAPLSAAPMDADFINHGIDMLVSAVYT